MNTLNRASLIRGAIGIALGALVAGCGVSKTTKESVARAETRVQQVQQAIGNAEGGAIELQRALDGVQKAKRAVEEGEDVPAQRHAKQAELDADLAGAKTQHANARKAADEMQASIQTLRQESQRSLGTAR
jgi:hypothetical protein